MVGTAIKNNKKYVLAKCLWLFQPIKELFYGLLNNFCALNKLSEACRILSFNFGL